MNAKLKDVESLHLESLSAVNIVITGSAKHELRLLCNIAKVMQEVELNKANLNKPGKNGAKRLEEINPITVGNLAIILLSMLKTYTSTPKFRLQEQWALDILFTYKSLLSRINDVSFHVGFISRLF